jgi:hypothetical protein
MAFQFNRNSGQKNGVVATVDSGQISKIREMGTMVTEVPNLTQGAMLSRSTPTNFSGVVPGKTVPGYRGSSGERYVAGDDGKSYLLSEAPIRTGGGGTTIINQTQTGGTMVGNNGGRPYDIGREAFPGAGYYYSGGSPTGFVDQFGNAISPLTPPPFEGDIIVGGGDVTPPPPPNAPPLGSGKVYTKFMTDDVVPNQERTVTAALWSNNEDNLQTMFTSSLQTATQKEYYYGIYNASSSVNCNYEEQFSVTYGNFFGSGSLDQGGQINDTPSRAIYGQYRLLCLDNDVEKFVVGGSAIDDFYAINVNRNRFKERLDEGNLEINLHHLSGSEFIAAGGDVNGYIGANVGLGAVEALRIIDDSKVSNPTITSAGEVYNLVSGSLEDGVFNSEAPHYYGLLYPRLGIAILDAAKLDVSASFGTSRVSEANADNAIKLFTSISGSGATLTDASGDPLGFQGRSSEKVKSTHFFARVKNQEYNFSNNPTFTTGSEGDLAHPDFIGDPQVYITTVGLYNERKELLAVAKMNQPLLKNYSREALVKVRLDF